MANKATSGPQLVSSGLEDLDAALDGGFLAGDNVVWFGGDQEVHDLLQAAFFRAAPARARRVLVSTTETTSQATRRLGVAVEVLDARPGQRHADPTELERAVVERGQAGAWVAIDGLDDLVRRLRPERALLLFSRICPQLFDAGAICYWRAGPGSRSIRDAVRGVTQCVLDVSSGRLRIDKAEGRTGVQGRVHRIHVDEHGLHLEPERALGRLAEGLRDLRSTRRLSQSEVARVAGVSPSAISQAESGSRGLGLDTVLAIAEGFGVGVDALLGAPANPGYVIARRDRSPARRGVTALLDDPAIGLRAHLVNLGPGEHGGPPSAHKGPELIVVASGLVQIDLGAETPVMRAGDAALATTTAVHGWRNLATGGSRFFWVLRDPLPRDA
jgi:transcriptional regulator with XRE-family HTH domain